MARFLILSNKLTSYRFFRFRPPPATFSPKGGGASGMATLEGPFLAAASSPLGSPAEPRLRRRGPAKSRER